jgi:hypothetical protein
MEVDSDLLWLKSQKPKKDLLHIKSERVRPIYKLISESNKDEWPMTIGLFGSWGAGKTTYLSYLVETMEQAKYKEDSYKVIYFNAWKYAGFMEVVPALIYKIIKFTGNGINKDLIMRVMLSLGNKYSSQIGEWAKKYIGINPVDLAKDVMDIKNASDSKAKILDEYYTQIDKAQDLLVEHFKDQVSPIIVLIDELDRCDPGEAFEVIKQLRVFFSMRDIPIIFILSANPEPIGLAVKHQYGLRSDINDYEAKRILEKFVDSYIDMSDPLKLGDFVRHVWSKNKIGSLSTIHDIDQSISPADYNVSTVKNADIFDAITTNNYLYSNLRVLQKSHQYVNSQSKNRTPLVWVAWHLEILGQIHEKLRRNVIKLASELGEITSHSHMNTIRDLKNNGVISSDGKVKSGIKLETDKGFTAFSIYRSWFWDISKDRLDHLRGLKSVESRENSITLEEMLKDHHVMDFIIMMSLFPLSRSVSDLFKKIDSDYNSNKDWRNVGYFKHFSWLLANY